MAIRLKLVTTVLHLWLLLIVVKKAKLHLSAPTGGVKTPLANCGPQGCRGGLKSPNVEGKPLRRQGGIYQRKLTPLPPIPAGGVKKPLARCGPQGCNRNEIRRKSLGDRPSLRRQGGIHQENSEPLLPAPAGGVKTPFASCGPQGCKTNDTQRKPVSPSFRRRGTEPSIMLNEKNSLFQEFNKDSAEYLVHKCANPLLLAIRTKETYLTNIKRDILNSEYRSFWKAQQLAYNEAQVKRNDRRVSVDSEIASVRVAEITWNAEYILPTATELLTIFRNTNPSVSIETVDIILIYLQENIKDDKKQTAEYQNVLKLLNLLTKKSFKWIGIAESEGYHNLKNVIGTKMNARANTQTVMGFIKHSSNGKENKVKVEEAVTCDYSHNKMEKGFVSIAVNLLIKNKHSVNVLFSGIHLAKEPADQKEQLDEYLSIAPARCKLQQPARPQNPDEVYYYENNNLDKFDFVSLNGDFNTRFSVENMKPQQNAWLYATEIERLPEKASKNSKSELPSEDVNDKKMIAKQILGIWAMQGNASENHSDSFLWSLDPLGGAGMSASVSLSKSLLSVGSDWFVSQCYDGGPTYKFSKSAQGIPDKNQALPEFLNKRFIAEEERSGIPRDKFWSSVAKNILVDHIVNEKKHWLDSGFLDRNVRYRSPNSKHAFPIEAQYIVNNLRSDHEIVVTISLIEISKDA